MVGTGPEPRILDTWLAGWLAGCGGWLAGWLAEVAGWLAGWLAN